jgi:hypothetical protein
MGTGALWLINVPPNSKIVVCASGNFMYYAPQKIADWMAEDIRYFASFISRDKYLTVVSSCDTDTKHRVDVIADYSSSSTYTFPQTRTVHINFSVLSSSLHREVVRHESGHLWGLCDMYPETVQHQDGNFYTTYGNRCRGGDPNRNGKNTNFAYTAATALMGNTSPGKMKLTQDDVDGMWDLATLPESEVPANALWRKILAENPEPSPGSSLEPPSTDEGPFYRPPSAASSLEVRPLVTRGPDGRLLILVFATNSPTRIDIETPMGWFNLPNAYQPMPGDEKWTVRGFPATDRYLTLETLKVRVFMGNGAIIEKTAQVSH